jgi:hypothetical protein
MAAISEVGSHQKSEGRFSCGSPLYHKSYRLETKFKMAAMNRISGSRIAPEIERNLLLCIPIIPQKNRPEPKFMMAAISGYPINKGQTEKAIGMSCAPSISMGGAGGMTRAVKRINKI